uniref:Male-specific Nldsx protein n=1 Tax=Nilaparvata lugens TaxID=108931 RepID=A0A2S1UGC6_NILLU|nr:male-specific Nldsx protein [Nilaparvata lugens]
MGGAAREARLPHESRAPSDANAACATTSGTNRTSPKCVRCRNHNEVSLLSGHKRFCRFRHCVCRNCQRTVKRQKKMAKQIAIRRRKKLEEERGELVPAATPPSPSTSSVDSADPPTVPSRWLPYSETSERSRHEAYEQKVSSTSSSTSGFSSIHSHAASQYAASCASPTGSVISVTALSDEDCQQPSNLRLRLAEMGTRQSPETVTRRSPSFAGVEAGSQRLSPAETVTRRLSPVPGAETGTFPVPDLEAVARLTGMVRRHGVDTETLLYVILNIVCPNVDEAYNRILNAQEEVRSLRNSSSPTPPPPMVTGRAGESSSGSPTPPSIYRTLPGHPLPPTPVMMPRAILGTTYYPAHLPFIGPIPTRMTLAGLTPPFGHLASFEEQYRSRNLPTAPLSLANVEESRRFPSM